MDSLKDGTEWRKKLTVFIAYNRYNLQRFLITSKVAAMKQRLFQILGFIYVIFFSFSADALFIDNGDGTITDTTTGLIWEQYGNGVYYKTLEEAIARIIELNKGPGTTWRIPTKMEFVGIAEYIFSSYSLSHGQIYWTLETPVAFYDTWKSYPSSVSAARVLAVRSQALPVANAGPDQVIFDIVTLDGSMSSASDSTIVSYQWFLDYRGGSTHNRSAEGERPTISNLQPGFYDVTLTVADNFGATGSDTMLLGAAGSSAILDERSRWDANGDNKIGLEEAIRALQIVSGLRTQP